MLIKQYLVADAVTVNIKVKGFTQHSCLQFGFHILISRWVLLPWDYSISSHPSCRVHSYLPFRNIDSFSWCQYFCFLAFHFFFPMFFPMFIIQFECSSLETNWLSNQLFLRNKHCYVWIINVRLLFFNVTRMHKFLPNAIMLSFYIYLFQFSYYIIFFVTNYLRYSYKCTEIQISEMYHVCWLIIYDRHSMQPKKFHWTNIQPLPLHISLNFRLSILTNSL